MGNALKPIDYTNLLLKFLGRDDEIDPEKPHEGFNKLPPYLRTFLTLMQQGLLEPLSKLFANAYQSRYSR